MRLRNNASVILAAWATLFLLIIISCLLYLIKIRNTVSEFAISNAKTDLQNKANETVLTVLTGENLEYDDISHISRNSENEITGIELDTKNANILKSKILLGINHSIPQQEVYTVNIPLGTVISNNLFGGLGPDIPFHSQISSGCNIDFKSDFESVGVNNTRHRILLEITLSGVILILGKHKGYSTKTTFIVAETVISGTTPQTFANISK